MRPIFHLFPLSDLFAALSRSLARAGGGDPRLSRQFISVLKCSSGTRHRRAWMNNLLYNKSGFVTSSTACCNSRLCGNITVQLFNNNTDDTCCSVDMLSPLSLRFTD